MVASTKIAGAVALREQVSRLRRELDETMEKYHEAKRGGDTTRAIVLLRRRSTLIRELFEAQGELLLSFRSDAGVEK